MRIEKLKVVNFKALKEIELDLDGFACFVGENNAGKSTVLQALNAFCTNRILRPQEFYDPTLGIRIEVLFGDIGEADMLRVAEEHRPRIQELVSATNTLKLAKIYGTDGKPTFRIFSLQPNDERLRAGVYSEQMKGKAGPELRAWFTENYADIDLPVGTTQTVFKEAIAAHVAGLQEDQKVFLEGPLPTGIDSSIKPLLPEAIYIPAVKDLMDDVKTTDSAAFGKLIGILLDSVKGEFNDLEEQLHNLRKRLSRVMVGEDEVDERIPFVKSVEEQLQKFVQESFPTADLKLNVPTPELKTILSGSEIIIDDGHESNLASKGDGLKRTVTFAILRTYNEFQQRTPPPVEGGPPTPKPYYLLLFEEPELYLHPRAQLQLFDALDTFSRINQVLVTTHSPLFLGPAVTKTFIKLYKEKPEGNGAPVTKHFRTDLRDVNARDQFQLICHENNSSAFFAKRVVLVEGDSDHIVMRHMAKIWNPSWNDRLVPIAFTRVGGKGSFERYNAFFRSFGVHTCVVADLDALISGFDKLGANPENTVLRGQLLQKIDESLAAEVDPATPTGERIRKVKKSGESRAIFLKAKEEFEAGNPAEATASLTEFFALAATDARLAALIDPPTQQILEIKNQLLTNLRDQNIYVLSRGCIEDYYGEEVSADRKVEYAVGLCNDISHIDQIPGKFHADGIEELRGIAERLYSEIA